MKRIMLASIVLSGLSFAQQKFACVDSSRILQESQTVKKAQEELKEKFQSYQKQLDEKTKKLEDLKKQIESKAISQKMKEERVKEYQKVEAEAMEIQQKAQRELGELKNKVEEDLTKKVKGVAEDISKKNSFTGILDCTVFVYKSPEIDITDEVIKKLDGK